MKVYISISSVSTSVKHRLLNILDDAKIQVGWEIADISETRSSIIDQANAVIALYQDTPSLNMIAEAAYAYGAGKHVLILGESEKYVPRMLKELPFGSSNNQEYMEQAVRDFLSECRRSPSNVLASPASFNELADLYFNNPIMFDEVDTRTFESLVRSVFDSRHMQVSTDDAGADHGFDFSISGYQGYDRTFVEVKKRKRNVRLPIAVIQQFYGAIAAYHADYGIVICPSGFSASAEEFAKRLQKIELWDMDKLVRYAR